MELLKLENTMSEMENIVWGQQLIKQCRRKDRLTFGHRNCPK